MRPAVLAPRARRDLAEAVRWIAKDNPSAAHGLRDAVIAAARRIGEHPYVGTVRSEVAGDRVRFLVLRGFPYVLVYAADREPPRILRVLHGARDLPDILRDLSD
ncbi:MAG TPA: type II toxin-antitoxin system RelE/ParE family toxin [Azospirillum sp.]|nr:type II toxin-antitoxin system RelE/ParE family toxin [Azospirillum sp.]